MKVWKKIKTDKKRIVLQILKNVFRSEHEKEKKTTKHLLFFEMRKYSNAKLENKQNES
jgi:hypothetical protein